MHDLEIMTTLFEAKLESLPDEIKSTYPPLQQCNLDDVNPIFSVNSIPNIQSSEQKPVQNEELQNENKGEGEEKKEEENKEEEKKEGEEEPKELTPQEELDQFLENNEDYRQLYKMLKIGVTVRQVEQKARLNGYDMDIFNEMVEKAKKVLPNIVD